MICRDTTGRRGEPNLTGLEELRLMGEDVYRAVGTPAFVYMAGPLATAVVFL